MPADRFQQQHDFLKQEYQRYCQQGGTSTYGAFYDRYIDYYDWDTVLADMTMPQAAPSLGHLTEDITPTNRHPEITL